MTSNVKYATPTSPPPAAAATPEAFTGLGPEGRRVFVGLMLGMLVASISQTIVSPALPRIVAELGGMEHYSWLATAAMLVSAVTVPIVGKLSDLYGRRSFYLAGLLVFMLGSVICGLAPSFWVLIAGRAVQGLGMGTLMPLSQTIIGDIIPPRQRGKYQGLMGAVFGVNSVAGPLIGGFITDNLGWRFLFFVTLPLGVVAFFAIARFLHLSHERRDAKVDVPGIVTLTVALVLLLLATSWGGTTYPWGSPLIISMYVGGVALIGLFIWIELRAEEPVIPLRLFANPIFTLANVASFAVAIAMFGAIFYIPVYAQGVLAVSATNSGLITMPLMLGLVVMGIVAGLLVTKTGRYKEIVLGGVVIMGVGYWLLTRVHHGDTQLELTFAMMVIGIGLGSCMQNFTLIVQNTSSRRDLGVATASSQFFRNVGSTVGVAVFGTIMTSQLPGAIARHLPPEAAGNPGAISGGVGAVLDPSQLAKLPPPIAEAIRMGLDDALHAVFWTALPVIACAFIAVLFIKPIPLRDTVHTAEEAGQEVLDGLAQNAADPERVPLGRDTGRVRTSERLLGLELGLLAREADRDDRPLLRQALVELGNGDLERGRELLRNSMTTLLSEDAERVADTEPYAAELGERAKRPGGVLGAELRQAVSAEAMHLSEHQEGAIGGEPVTDRHRAVDVDAVRDATQDLVAAFLVDVLVARRAEVAAGPGTPERS
ncbi:MDR family MFS transporter [Propionibacteriaceae bacterium Y2011]